MSRRLKDMVEDAVGGNLDRDLLAGGRYVYVNLCIYKYIHI